MRKTKRRRPGRRVVFGSLTVALAAFAGLGADDSPTPPPERSPLRIVVMDPLSNQLACDCVAGYAQRKYDALGRFLEERLARPVEIVYAESLKQPHAEIERGVDLVIGKCSEVVFDAARAKLDVRTLAMLTGQEGTVTQTGLFVVRSVDPARSVEDLNGFDKDRILFGPEDSVEKRAAALAALEAFDVPIPPKIPESPSSTNAALAVVEEEADAAVVSSYAMPLLEGCGAIDKGALRIVGHTDPVPFIGVFATDRVGPGQEAKVLDALVEVGNHADLLLAMESRDGFLKLPSLSPAPGAKHRVAGAKRSGAPGSGALGLRSAQPPATRQPATRPISTWPDWRGPRRDAISEHVPQKLPAGLSKERLLWSRTLTGPGMAGLAVDAGYVVVADKDLELKSDVFRCLDADTGRQLWKISYPAPKEMDFTNTPRANPVIHGGLVYLLGAFGDLHCLKLASGEVVWKRRLLDDFGAKLPTWGMCSTPLVVDDFRKRLIVNPGAEDASIAALDRLTGKVLWTTPGEPPGYSSFILAELGGVRQIVGYDAISLGGWDPQTGQRLWKLMPEWDGDFNVPTPIVAGDKLLVSTENNGTRLYRFDEQGRIDPEPVAKNEDLAPDTSTPVVLDGMVFGNFGALLCLDLDNGLSTLWEADDDDALIDYCSFIAGNGRVLVTTQSGKLYLLRATKKGFDPVSTLDLFPDVASTDRDVWSHPALVENRLYVRNLLGVYCFLLD